MEDFELDPTLDTRNLRDEFKGLSNEAVKNNLDEKRVSLDCN